MTDTPTEPQAPEVVLGDAPEIVGSPWLIQDTDQEPTNESGDEEPDNPTENPDEEG
jgi:hypothetical protein